MEGMHTCTHLVFSGQCEAAFRHYERCLEARISFLMRYSESPQAVDVPPGFSDRVYHSSLEIGNQRITGADNPSGSKVKHEGFSLALRLDDPAEADRIFGELAVDGQVQVPIQETFWAARFGMVTDCFGIPWMIDCGKQE